MAEYVVRELKHMGQTYSLPTADWDTWDYFWDGHDWTCIITQDTTMCAKEYNFTNFTVCPWVKVYFCWCWVPVIKACDKFCNAWTIELRSLDICAAEVCLWTYWSVHSHAQTWCFALNYNWWAAWRRWWAWGNCWCPWGDSPTMTWYWETSYSVYWRCTYETKWWCACWDNWWGWAWGSNIYQVSCSHSYYWCPWCNATEFCGWNWAHWLDGNDNRNMCIRSSAQSWWGWGYWVCYWWHGWAWGSWDEWNGWDGWGWGFGRYWWWNGWAWGYWDSGDTWGTWGRGWDSYWWNAWNGWRAWEAYDGWSYSYWHTWYGWAGWNSYRWNGWDGWDDNRWCHSWVHAWKWWCSMFGNAWRWGTGYQSATCANQPWADWWSVFGWAYWLAVFWKVFYNNCIIWCWGQGWRWWDASNDTNYSGSRGWNGWNGWAWAEIKIYYGQNLNTWTILCAEWKGWYGWDGWAWAWNRWCDWEKWSLIFSQIQG